MRFIRLLLICIVLTAVCFQECTAYCFIDNGGCEDICSDSTGRVRCSCRFGGQLLSDLSSCHYWPMFVHSTERTITLDFNHTVYTFINTAVTALAHDYSKKRIFYSASNAQTATIGVISLPRLRHRKLHETFGKIHDITHGEEGSLFYSMTEPGKSGIYEIQDVDDLTITFSLLVSMNDPRGLSFDKCSGYIFVADYTNSWIVRISSSTKRQVPIITSGLSNPTALSIDSYTEKVFWGNRVYKKIEMSNYDGSCRETVSILSNADPLSMTFLAGQIFFANKQSPHGIYWTKIDDGSTLHVHDSISQATSVDYFGQFIKGKWSSWETSETCCSGVCGEEKRKRTCQSPHLSNYNQACVKPECKSYTCDGFEEDVSIKNCDDNLCSGCNACSINNGGCEDQCSQISGAAVCSCGFNGKLQSDGKTCAYQNIVVYSNGSTIKFESNTTVFNVDIPAGQKIMSIKSDYTNKRIIYGSSERGKSIIAKVSLKGAKVTKLIEQRGDIFAIFYDEDSGSLYYTIENYAAGVYKIENIDATGLSSTLVRRMSSPKGIIVDSCIGYIFVVDEGTREIIRITSNTLQSTPIITTGLYQPSAITVDPYTEKLFWSDSAYKRIEMANYDGSCRKPMFGLSAAIPTMIFHNGFLVFPYSSLKLVVFIDLFTHVEHLLSRSTHPIQASDYFSKSEVSEGHWSSWDENEGCCNGTCGEQKFTRICKSPFSFLYLNQSCINTHCKTRFNCNGRHEDVRIDVCDKRNCPDCGACLKNNGGCEETCSDVSGSLRCACNKLGTLMADGKSCSYSQSLIYSNGTTIQFHDVDISIPNRSSKTLKALVEDFSKKRLFYAAVGGGESELGIFTLNGLQYKTLIRHNGSVSAVAFNINNNILYYTIEDTAPGIYLLQNIDSTVPTSSLLHSMAKPKGIAFAKCSGYLFAVGESAKEIVRIKSGTVTTIISNGLSNPTSVTVDDITGKLFWIDTGLGRIEMSNFDGSCRKTVKVFLTTQPLSILFFKGMLLYTNKQSSFGIHQLDIVTGASTSIKSTKEPVLAIEYFGTYTKESSWSSWVTNEDCCSGVCGEEKFIRKCQSPYHSQYEKSCINATCISSNSCGGQHQQITAYSCNQARCKVNGGWSEWIEGECSQTCGNGVKRRERSCTSPKPICGDACTGLKNSTVACNLNDCYGTWGEWEKFDECSKTCGTGVRSRSRLCITSSQLISCIGESKETLKCNETPCISAETGTWGEWEKFDECSKSCGTGVRSRSRVCITSSQLISCIGESRETLKCNETPCTAAQTGSDSQPGMIGGVTGGVGIVIILVIIVAVYVLLKRRALTPKTLGGNNNHGQRNQGIELYSGQPKTDPILPEAYDNVYDTYGNMYEAVGYEI